MLNAKDAKKHSIKCIVWDLDNTLWDNVLLEDEQVILRPGVVEVIKTLDSRGILHSIASKNDYSTTMRKLAQLGLSEYFLYPQINWNSKSSSIKSIAASINIGLDTVAFVDDQPFEREEVAFSLPQVLCIDSDWLHDIRQILDMPEMMPRFITEDSAKRRKMYLNDILRAQAEKEFVGPSEEFLTQLHMVFTIAPAREADLQRAEELTVRTHQLNTTGRTYSYEELNEFRQSPKYKLLIADLEDKYGTYGKIGLALIACDEHVWTIKLLLMSCRVMSRSVGSIMMNYIMMLAKEAHVHLQADFLSNDRNRMMYVTYKFGGFKEIDRTGNLIVFEHDLAQIQPFPPYVTVQLKGLDFVTPA
jgi:FkbH-like protein